MEELKKLLEEFIDWARDCGEDAFYIFEETDEAIKKFFEQRLAVWLCKPYHIAIRLQQNFIGLINYTAC